MVSRRQALEKSLSRTNNRTTKPGSKVLVVVLPSPITFVVFPFPIAVRIDYGTKLDLFDLMVALTWTTDFHLQNEFKDIQAFLKKKNFDGIKKKILLQCISVILKESCKTKVITSLKGAEIRDNL